MSDLISRKQISNYIKAQINPYGKPFYGTTYELGLKIMEYIDNMNSAYDVDKVVEELEEEKNKLYNARNKLSEKMYVDKSAFNRVQVLQAKELSIHEAIEIVKGGGVNEEERRTN